MARDYHPTGVHRSWPYGGGPIWIDPRFYEQHKYRACDRWETTTTDNTRPLPPRVVPVPVDEEQVRKIVREEIADLPIQFDVPDEPPES